VTIKDSAEGWVRSKPMLAMVAVAALGLVIGGLVGLGVGYKVEKNRVQDDVQRIKSQLKDTGATTSSKKTVQRVGEVKAVSGTTLTVTTKLQGDQDIHTSSTTKFLKTAEGKTADIAVGKKLLVAAGGKEIIILSDDSEIGRQVTRVSDDGFVVALKEGKSGTVKAMDVQKVYTLTPATAADAKVGTGVVVAGKQAGTDGFQASEVIVLPDGSAFNS
jgi:hypothetical protein